jgi:hypothetical protein
VALPYARAGASGVLLLAYGAARPVVAYPVDGLAEAVVDGETGWLCARPIPPRSPPRSERSRRPGATSAPPRRGRRAARARALVVGRDRRATVTPRSTTASSDRTSAE